MLVGRQVVHLAGCAGREAEQLGDVHAGDAVGGEAPDLGRDHRAGVVADRAVLVVAEPGHQFGPGVGGALRAPPGPACRAGEAESGQGRDHDVERLGGVGAVTAWVGQRADQVEVLDD